MSAYSFLDVTCAMSGPSGSFSLGAGAGVAEEGITVEPVEDRNTMTTGADGKVQHSLHGAKSATVTVRLLKTSPVNAQLSQAFNAQTSSAALHGKNTIVISDAARGDNHTLQQVAFKSHPTIAYSKAGELNEWRFDAGVWNPQLGTGTPEV